MSRKGKGRGGVSAGQRVSVIMDKHIARAERRLWAKEHVPIFIPLWRSLSSRHSEWQLLSLIAVLRKFSSNHVRGTNRGYNEATGCPAPEQDSFVGTRMRASQNRIVAPPLTSPLWRCHSIPARGLRSPLSINLLLAVSMVSWRGPYLEANSILGM